ncbi:hypothetical protein EO087_00105 [Dyella sp. M7H15-1]|uniref:hypothetical protein n=1 Tax=Dyella sp. M7H15-1 TaxID=2501295 RepID=UPI0010051875|nr:hypothetical protein [Dyella sp. M7H15-1]QAU22571.1 hypothetical protein EO087_00105 [Dyella sp. M7H15-1]
MDRLRPAHRVTLLRARRANLGMVGTLVSLHWVEVPVRRGMSASPHAGGRVDPVALEVLAGFAADHAFRRKPQRRHCLPMIRNALQPSTSVSGGRNRSFHA